MALRISLPSPMRSASLNPPPMAVSVSSAGRRTLTSKGRRNEIGSGMPRGVSGVVTGGSARFSVRSSLETGSVTAGQVTEVDKDTFWPIVRAADPKIVVLDMYTQWCGPCKVISPKFKELSEKYLDVVFLKLDCNQENKSLAKELGIRVVPTFKILKDGKIVKEVTGAKIPDLIDAIDTVRTSC